MIVEPNEAKAVLNWAVREMEERYKVLAAPQRPQHRRVQQPARGRRRRDADERMPYIVLIIDELADLIMREGRKVEDPIVKIAQKARAVGIHLVLATQRPSVNVVTGLIKANVPSRIAFAMASMIDSRTVLDAPGAEDLIGRGDMLYQPVDLPRPVRMQGVFVERPRGRRESRSTGSTRPAAGPFYDEDILAFSDAEDGNGGDGGQFGWLAQVRRRRDDRRRRPSSSTTSQRASTSMLQTKLKLGFARASRVMDELERYGIIGPQDPRNPAVAAARSTVRTTGSARSTTATDPTNERSSHRSLWSPAMTRYPLRRGRPPARARLRTTRTGIDDDRDDARRTSEPRPEGLRLVPPRPDQAPTRPPADRDGAPARTATRAVRREPADAPAGAPATRPASARASTCTAPSATRRSGRATSPPWSAASTASCPGDVYTKGFLRNYALYLGLDPEEVVAQWRRERGDGGPRKTGPDRPAADRPAAAGPPVLAGDRRRRPAHDPDRRRRRVARASRSCASRSRRRST